jgi:hypothetical protein|tara:strand:+ start:13906 stop:14286 length:381 start_codon:yes stop_codon:yes gene_type:complete
MESPQFQEIPDEEIKKAIEGYEFIMPGDQVRIIFKKDTHPDVPFIEGELRSLLPAYMIKDEQGELHSLSRTIVAEVILLKKDHEKNFERAISLREQYRKYIVLDSVLSGAINVRMEHKQPSGNDYL